jgi:hypothetical protein
LGGTDGGWTLDHKSKRLNMSGEAPDCACGHADERHHIQWLSRPLAPEELFGRLPVPIVHCLDCLEREISAKRLANQQILDMVRALQETDPRAAVIVELLEASERVFRAREESASGAEIDRLSSEHDSLVQKANELGILISMPPRGNA